jgi:hypothetical protein
MDLCACWMMGGTRGARQTTRGSRQVTHRLLETRMGTYDERAGSRPQTTTRTAMETEMDMQRRKKVLEVDDGARGARRRAE